MSRPEKLIPPTLGLDFELRIIPPNETQPGLGTRLAAIGPWEGVGLDDLMRILREDRESGGSAAPPEMP